MKKARSAEYFEAWKKVAGQRVHLVFGLLPIKGPTIPSEMKEDVIEMIRRITWYAPCDYMTDEERGAAARVNRDAMRKYSWEIAQREAPERWKRVLAATK